jgi:kynurenine formamidase
MSGTVSALLTAIASGEVEVVDLTQPLSETTPIIYLPPPFVNTPGLKVHEISHYDERGPAWAWRWLEIGEHVGTHFDAPIHWITGKDDKDIASIPASDLVGPAVVFDRVAETEANPDYLLTVDDIRGWEAEHGSLPVGGWLFLRTGWDARADDAEAFLNAGSGMPQSPGIDAECARYLAHETPLVGVGVETVGIDAGAAGGFDPPFPVHNYMLGAGKYGVTQLANLAKLPPAGALVVIAPLKLVGGTGSPVRALAFVPKG